MSKEPQNRIDQGPPAEFAQLVGGPLANERMELPADAAVGDLVRAIAEYGTALYRFQGQGVATYVGREMGVLDDEELEAIDELEDLETMNVDTGNEGIPRSDSYAGDETGLAGNVPIQPSDSESSDEGLDVDVADDETLEEALEREDSDKWTPEELERLDGKRTPAADVDVRMSRVEAECIGAWYCPDCTANPKINHSRIALMMLREPIPHLHCSICNNHFRIPSQTLERIEPDEFAELWDDEP